MQQATKKEAKTEEAKHTLDNIPEWKIRVLQHKAYFDDGFTLLNYVKYLIILFGISSLDIEKTIILGLIYGVVCYIVGYIYYNRGWRIAQAEIGNRYNKFVLEMRAEFNGDKNGKKKEREG